MVPPVVSATLLATVLATVSNVLAQQLASRNRGEEHFTPSLPELSRFVLFSLITAPLNFYWQHLLERTFPGRDVPRTYTALPRHENENQLEIEEPVSQKELEARSKLNWKNTMIKWFVDCITMGALLNTTAFLIIMGLLKGRTLAEIGTALRTETFPIIFASYKIWPLASVVNFALVPVEKRIVFLSAVGVAWGVYMSFMAAKQ